MGWAQFWATFSQNHLVTLTMGLELLKVYLSEQWFSCCSVPCDAKRHTVRISTNLVQGSQMVYFQTQNPNLGKFWRALERKMLVYLFYDHSEYFTALWYNLWPFGIIYGPLV
jgi:hypothetical protein